MKRKRRSETVRATSATSLLPANPFSMSNMRAVSFLPFFEMVSYLYIREFSDINIGIRQNFRLIVIVVVSAQKSIRVPKDV